MEKPYKPGWIAQSKLAALQANLFPAAHPAIGDWQAFEWHCNSKGEPQADKVQSSQALAIDVFGTIAAAPSRDKVLDALAVRAELPPGGPWRLELEWRDPANLLREPRQTQVDAIAIGANAIMVIECKFTETGGSCSQTNRLSSGPGKGMRQCNGRYENQTHPVSGVANHCTLSGKGIRYWDAIPNVFALDPEADHAPCPFSGEAFQWMRNLILASELGRHQGKVARCLIAYAAGGGFPTEAKVQGLDWLPALAEGAQPPMVLSYQEIAELAATADSDPCWPNLQHWIDKKISLVATSHARKKVRS